MLSHKPLPLEIEVRLLVVHIPFVVFKLFLGVGIPVARPALFQVLPQLERLVYLGHLEERLRRGNAERVHRVDVFGLLEVALVLPAALVVVAAADVACVLLVEAVQLVEPVRDGLAVDTRRQLERVVDVLVLRGGSLVRGRASGYCTSVLHIRNPDNHGCVRKVCWGRKPTHGRLVSRNVQPWLKRLYFGPYTSSALRQTERLQQRIAERHVRWQLEDTFPIAHPAWDGRMYRQQVA
jgi:hypothetical protein